jgi:hypothetical protein
MRVLEWGHNTKEQAHDGAESINSTMHKELRSGVREIEDIAILMLEA